MNKLIKPPWRCAALIRLHKADKSCSSSLSSQTGSSSVITGKKPVPRRWPKIIYRLLRERVSTEKLQTTHESAASKQHSSSRIYDPLCLNIRARADPGAPKRLRFIKKRGIGPFASVCAAFLDTFTVLGRFLLPLRTSEKTFGHKSDSSLKCVAANPVKQRRFDLTCSMTHTDRESLRLRQIAHKDRI